MAYQNRVLAADNPLGQPAIRLVLLVDDSKLQRCILAALLRRWGYEVMEAASGEAALAKCRVRLPDLVLSDWMMPGMSGPDFCRAFRALTKERYAYFILLSAKTDKTEVAQGLDSGADDFLTKPLNNDELRARIAAGERILVMQRELTQKNSLITETLTELQRVYDSFDKDLIEAQKLQQSLLRERHRSFDQADLTLLLRSSGHVGGDLVGSFRIGESKLGIFGLDVSGHGISSALMTARLAGHLSGAAPEQNIALIGQADGGYGARRPSEVVARLNNFVLNEMKTEHYFTLVFAIADLETGQVTLSQAGHPHPILERIGGDVEQIGNGGFPVGLMPGVTFEEIEFTLAPGDRLLILSDGVTECPDLMGNMLEESGLRNMMSRIKELKGPAYFEALIWELCEFSGLDEFPDDVSGLLFEYTG